MASESSVDQIIDSASNAVAPLAGNEERRTHVRHPYPLLVGLILLDEEGQRTEPIVLRGKDIAKGGLCLTCRHPLESKRLGVVQLVRSNGRLALAGVEVRHCKCVTDETHEVGLMFVPFPDSLRKEEFLDANGKLSLFDPLLKENVQG